LRGFSPDGQSFRFDLNSEHGHGDYFSPESIVSIIYAPEPSTIVLSVLAMVALAVRRRKSVRHKSRLTSADGSGDSD